MEKIGIGKLRANLPTFLKKIAKGDIVVITCRGREVARLVPPDDRAAIARVALQKLRNTAIIGDIVSPTGEKWEAAE